jgi:hypothetical protein
MAPTSAVLMITFSTVVLLAACQPTIRVKVPNEPIVINLNVRIEREVRIKIERDAEELIRRRSDIF